MTANIQILYDGQEALTTALFASRYRLSKDTARKTLTERLGVEPFPEPLDERTKLWPAAQVAEAMKKRPGKGANLRKPR